MSDAERVFKDRFDEVVLAKRPVLYMPDRRSSIVDSHHTLPKSWMKFRLGSRLEPEEVWAVIWDPDCGLPAERPRHEQLTNGHRRLELGELREENIAFAERHGWLGRLAVEAPFLLEMTESG